jgi:programmed cell death protein 5
MESQDEEVQKQMQAMQQLENLLRQLLTPNAKSRLSNVKIANPDKYYKVANIIIQMYQSGQIDGKVDEEMLISLLQSLNVRKKFNIKRK